MTTIALTIFLEASLQEFLIAELADLDFDAFEQEEEYVKAYIPGARWNDVTREQIQRWLASHDQPVALHERVIEPQNWNRQWEETIRPIVVGPFLVKPTWADVPPAQGDLILLEIDPKMSFGTGYHESTRLALRLLAPLVEGGERVLDAGTGTGILAIAALRLGASSAVAFDNDEWSLQNAVENFHLNRVVDQVEFRTGSIEVVPEGDFDIILANINLNVLLGFLPVFAGKMSAGGRAVLAGLLRQDRERILSAARSAGLALVREETENDWWAAVVAR